MLSGHLLGSFWTPFGCLWDGFSSPGHPLLWSGCSLYYGEGLHGTLLRKDHPPGAGQALFHVRRQAGHIVWFLGGALPCHSFRGDFDAHGTNPHRKSEMKKAAFDLTRGICTLTICTIASGASLLHAGITSNSFVLSVSPDPLIQLLHTPRYT